MAISFVQRATNSRGSAGTTLAVSFTNPIAAGSIIAVAGQFDPTSATSLTGATDKGDSLTDSGLGYISYAAPALTFVKAFLTATTASQTVTLTYNASVGYADIVVWEIAGLTGAGFDKFVNTVSTAANPTSGFTGTLSTANEAAIAFGSSASSFNTFNTPWANNTATGLGSQGAERVLSATTSIQADSGPQGGGSCSTWCVTFMSGAGVIVIPPSPISVASPTISTLTLICNTLVLGQYAIDIGLSAFALANKILICSQTPTTYAEANTFTVGVNNFGIGNCFGAPTAGASGRKVVSVAITSGSITANGTAMSWAVIDDANSRLLAVGPINGIVAVTIGQSFTLDSFEINLSNN